MQAGLANREKATGTKILRRLVAGVSCVVVHSSALGGRMAFQTAPTGRHVIAKDNALEIGRV